MKNIIYLLLVLSAINSAAADDVEDIIQASIAHFDAQNDGDAEARIAHHLDYHTQFADGAELKVGTSLAEQLSAARALYSSGIKFDLKLTDIKVKTYDKAAVVTGYVVGTITTAEGAVLNAHEQRTAVLIKAAGEWKEVHVHISPRKKK